MTIGASPTRPSAPSRELRTRGRRPIPESPTPCITSPTVVARSSSLEEAG